MIELVSDNTQAMPANPNVQDAREMSRFAQWRFRVVRWLLWQRRKYLPYLVWWQEEVDVVVTFSQDRLSDGAESVEALRALFSGELHQAEKSLRAMGVSFDTGMGFGGRDWEWDYSLAGPISVRFKRRSERPERRRERPKPKLVEDA